ncbi:hypothetical protein Btru_040157 [Bulinus truncatus]|nr:hypothetical protein Btru_040157 [Bulinus truncatus]
MQKPNMERYLRLVGLYLCMLHVYGSTIHHVHIETSDTKWQHGGYNTLNTNEEDGMVREPSGDPQTKRFIHEVSALPAPNQRNTSDVSADTRGVEEVIKKGSTDTLRLSNGSGAFVSNHPSYSTLISAMENLKNPESGKKIHRDGEGENQPTHDNSSFRPEAAPGNRDKMMEATKSVSKLYDVIRNTSMIHDDRRTTHANDHSTPVTPGSADLSKESHNSSDGLSYNPVYYSLNSSSNISQAITEQSSYTWLSHRDQDVTPETSPEVNAVTPTDLTDPTSDETKKDCPTCGSQGLSEEEVKELRMNMFADLLRQKLRMPEVPDGEEAVTQKAPVLPTDLLKRIFRNDTPSDDAEGFYAIDDEIIIPGEDMSSMCDGLNMSGCYLFDLKNKFSSDIATAYLWFNRSHEKLGKWRQPHIFVYEIEVHSGTTLKRKIHLARNDLLNKNDWVTVNLTMSVRRWVGEGVKSKLLAIKCKNCGTAHSDSDTDIQMDYKPVLEIKYFKTKPEQRRKKNANCDPRTECCKRPLDVNFNSINMHNIVLPNSLSVYFCYGYCDGVNQFTYNHTALKQRVRWTGNLDASMREQLKPCCVPLVLKDAAIMVNENNDVVTKILPKVIVERCGCKGARIRVSPRVRNLTIRSVRCQSVDSEKSADLRPQADASAVRSSLE